jgi:hypothetical protein
MRKLKYDLKKAKEKSLTMGYKLVSGNFFRTRDKYEFYCIKHKQIHSAIFDIESYMSNKKLRLELSNGACLCVSCHTKFHKTYGYGDNTRKQFNEFMVKK